MLRRIALPLLLVASISAKNLNATMKSASLLEEKDEYAARAEIDQAKYPWLVHVADSITRNAYGFGAIITKYWVVGFSSEITLPEVKAETINVYTGKFSYDSSKLANPLKVKKLIVGSVENSAKLPTIYLVKVCPAFVVGSMATLGTATVGATVSYIEYYDNEGGTTLQESDVKVAEQCECEDKTNWVEEKEICLTEIGAVVFYGADSGFPVVSNGKLIGMASSEDSAYHGLAAVLDLSKYRAWIEQQTGTLP